MSAATRLHVSGLPRELLDDDLRARFTPFGAVSNLEVCREKENSPFLTDPSDAPHGPSSPDRGGRGGRGGRGSRGKKKGGRGEKPPSKPVPCRGYAFVTVDFPDDQSLRRCLNAYNGTKWKGHTLHVHPAKPRFDERLRMEREGIRLDRPEKRGGIDDQLRELIDDMDAEQDEGGEDEDEYRPLSKGDEMEIDGRVRNSKVTVTYAGGAVSHIDEFPDHTTPIASSPDWTPFPDDASDRTLRRLCQLPGMVFWKPKPARGGGGRRGEDTDGMEIVRDGDDGESSGGEAEAGVSDGSGGDAGPTDRFNLPREFFSSDVAASRAATNAAGDGDGVEPRERFGLVNRLKGAADDDKQEPGSKKRKKDTVEMRALAAFLGGDSEDRDGDEADAGKVEEMAKPTPVKKTTKESAPRPKTTDPEEGGIPMAQTAPKWWESEAPKPDKTVATTGGKPAGLTKDFFAPRSTAPADAVTSTAAPVRDFFRAVGSAPFVPRANRPAVQGEGEEDEGDSDGDVGEIDVDSDAFSEDDEGAQLSEEEDDEDEDVDEDEGHGTSSGSDGDSADSDDEGAFEEDSSGAEDDESDGEGDSDSGDLDVVDFD